MHLVLVKASLKFLKCRCHFINDLSISLSNGDFGLQAPDTEPYKTVNRYIQKENSLLDTLGKDKPISRPWIQDFTASYLGAGNYIDYDAKAISEEVQALKDNGVNEFLLWNAGNDYTEGVNYNPKKAMLKNKTLKV